MREWDDYFKAKKALRLESNSQLIEAAARALNFTIEIKSQYHWRLSKPGCATCDVWPQSGKTKFLGFANRVMVRHDLAGFLDKHFSCV